MKTLYHSLLALPLVGLLAACNPGTHVSTSTGNVSSDGKNITLRADGQPDARISANGDLTIDGKAVTLNAAQRVLLQSYKTQMDAMTADGIAIGKQGAKLAGKAVGAAIQGAINGDDGDKVGSQVEAEAKKIEQQAMQLCKRLVTIKTSQDALAEQLPAFKPYATIDDSDVHDCGSSNTDSYAVGKEVGSSLVKAAKGEEQATTSEPGDVAAKADAAAEESASNR